MYRTILVPVDISEEELTSKAVRCALDIARETGAKLHILHVLPISSAIINAYALGYMEIKDKATVKAEGELAMLVDSIDLPNDRISYSISFGSPRDEITSTADEIEADLIVIGSRRPNITTHLLGSNSAGIVRYAKTSVLVVR
ncbi:universal stress protein [Xenorhabdus bovienii]|uniref:Universal stress protein n=1 Tax=Xenorhabdus bovienii TaxID=40576 RepID=A0A0B6X7V2_XENBV|nr:universal stress protein [Xenorhabdus bovienii]CDG89452.1 universal stress protein UP12, flavoprotein, ETFP adenine nucleotide-binding domain [Xenorhabdus bovienii str. feltiae France]CDG93654.1 universal stress protein UP12, flavoprotein,ETFP adenine nucleotide-binding domain [Xenorhabdus bovienii str. feltiae Florida]CDM89645.1 universal stress protein UP12, flavoprotein, ETFP adenine nucleotide-binding domain [Xenorhabdus bovienii]